MTPVVLTLDPASAVAFRTGDELIDHEPVEPARLA
jgi:hypothetical protein